MKTKKGKIIVGAILVVLFILVLLIPFLFGQGVKENKTTCVVGTWYSDKPDMLTFGKNGEYHFDGWNGGNAWLTSGTYTVTGNSVILDGSLDGKTTLTLSTVADGSLILSGKYSYYSTEDAAKTAIEKGQQQAAKDQEDMIPNTIESLIGNWTSLDGTTTCTYTKTSFTVHYKGNATTAEESQTYDYQIVSDRLMTVSQDGMTNNFNYSLYEKNGELYLNSPVKVYASTYKKDAVQGKGTSVAPGKGNAGQEGSQDASSSYTGQLTAYVEQELIGTWKGTLDEYPGADSVYSSYTFQENGKYTYSDGVATESGTYTVLCDAADVDYNGALTLTSGSGSRTVKFYFTATTPAQMVTDQADPTFVKR